jgi:hypothetical protein
MRAGKESQEDPLANKTPDFGGRLPGRDLAIVDIHDDQRWAGDFIGFGELLILRILKIDHPHLHAAFLDLSFKAVLHRLFDIGTDLLAGRAAHGAMKIVLGGRVSGSLDADFSNRFHPKS